MTQKAENRRVKRSAGRTVGARRKVSTVSKGRRGVRRLASYESWKGVVDRLAAALALIVLSPLMVAIAVCIRIDSPGNPLFRQERVGKDGRRFVLCKFRSMYIDHDDTKKLASLKRYVLGETGDPDHEAGCGDFDRFNDPRVTRVGALLRKTNLDELPQLWNILKGDMSFVGPRPDIPFSVDLYQEHHWKRFSVTPGLTGLWQVSGRKSLSFEDMVRLDVDYISRQSLLLDTRIMLRTVLTVLGRDGS